MIGGRCPPARALMPLTAALHWNPGPRPGAPTGKFRSHQTRIALHEQCIFEPAMVSNHLSSMGRPRVIHLAVIITAPHFPQGFSLQVSSLLSSIYGCLATPRTLLRPPCGPCGSCGNCAMWQSETESPQMPGPGGQLPGSSGGGADPAAFDPSAAVSQ